MYCLKLSNKDLHKLIENLKKKKHSNYELFLYMKLVTNSTFNIK